METFESMLASGKPNSLGRTVEVVDIVLADNQRFEELFQCYFSADEWVRLRVSNAMKRICRDRPALLIPYIDRFIDDVATIEQASAQWTLAQLFLMLESELTPSQKQSAVGILQHNLDTSDDWIVQNQTVETLGRWAQDDPALLSWLVPRLGTLARSPRKSVAGRAERIMKQLDRS